MKKLSKVRSQSQTESHIVADSDFKNILIILIVSTIPYYPSLFGEFVFDDAESIVSNPIVTGKEHILNIFIRDFWGKQSIHSPTSHKSYRPLTTFTFWLNYSFHGTSTFGYHVINIFLHFVASLLVYQLAKVLVKNSSIPLTASIIFAVHPVHTEAVANITGRAEILMTIFGLLGIMEYIRSNRISRYFVLYVIFSVLSKEQGAMIIPICIIFDVISNRFSKNRFFVMTTFFLSICFIRLFINGFQSAKFSKLDNPAAFLDHQVFRTLNYIYLWTYHIHLLIFPINLCFDYSMGCISSITSISDYRILSPVIFLIGVLIAARYGHRQRDLLFPIMFASLAFLPSSNIFFTVGFTVAERILYLPSVGFSILCSLFYNNGMKKWKQLEVIAVTILILAVSKTYHRSTEWQNELNLFSSGLTVCPTNAKIHYNLGKIMGDKGYSKDAERNYWNAIKLNPSYEQALNNLGNLLEKSGNAETAENLLARAISLRPNFPVAWMNLGIAQMKLKKFEQAEKSFRNSLKLRPNSAHCLFNIGVLYQKTNREILAMEAWRNATILESSHIPSWTNLLVVLDQLNHCDEVIRLAPKVLAIAPLESTILMQIGACNAQENNFEEAEHYILKAIEIQPTSSLYHMNLGVLYQKMKKTEQAATQYRIARMLDSKNNLAKLNLQRIENTFANSTNN